jgi:hypothetical protein
VRGDGGPGPQDRGQEAPAGPVGRDGVAAGAFRQAIAVDWSGRADRAGQRRAIWTACARGGELAALRTGRDRREAVDALLGAVAGEPATIVGLDFAFSWPRWYLDEQGLAGPEDAWAHAGALADRPSRDLPPPFWGAGIRRLADAGLEGRERYRITETAPNAVAARARSTFHAGGAGTVGLQSIRGMPHLSELRRAGVAIWPFEPPVPGRPVAVEIFPRMIARALRPRGAGTGAGFRSGVLGALGSAALAGVSGAGDRALASQDAFDAAVSAIVLARDGVGGLTPPAADAADREGWIWGARLA